MNNVYKFSMESGVFYPACALEEYELPADVVDASDSAYQQAMGARMAGLAFVIGDNGDSVIVAPSAAHEWSKKQSAWVLNENLANDLAMQAQIAAMVSASEAVRERLNFEIDKKANEISQAVGADFKTAAGLMAFCGYPNQFRAIAEQFGAWAASVWTAANTYKAEVLAGTKPMLTPDEAVALMPEYAE